MSEYEVSERVRARACVSIIPDEFNKIELSANGLSTNGCLRIEGPEV